MSITADVTIYVKFSGDDNHEYIFDSGALPNSPADVDLITLAIGDNVVTVPLVTGFTAHGVVIIPPDGNTEEILLKGNIADTGLALSASRVTVIPFGAVPAVDFALTVSVAVSGVRLIWF